ncbi:MAG TPA: glycerophosphodiester phosphodiesterase, partial [Thermomicrobiales bacterium]|nr:glycerophosphodiester phosphodiesterase [Thermomicrobiales bacterium]
MEIVGHGGAGHFYPGNSRKAVQKGLDLGVDRIEIDVQIAGDGNLVLLHDDVIRFEGKRRPVRQLTLGQLREQFDDLLTLDEVIRLVENRASLQIDLKSPGYEREIAAAISRSGIATTAIVSSTYALSLRRVRAHVPGVRTGLSTGHISSVTRLTPAVRVISAIFTVIAPIPLLSIAKLTGASFLMLNYRIASRPLLRLAERIGIGSYVWTVDNPKSIRKMSRLD